MATLAYNRVVAARTRLAEHVLAQPELLDQFVAAGGLPSDLETIAATGKQAEAAHHGQSLAAAPGIAATQEVQAAFAALQRDYKAIMAVVTAVRRDLADAGASAELVEAVDRILLDETAVHIKVTRGEGDAVRKKALKLRSQEAIRAEIHKDAAALLAYEALAAPLAARKVDAERLGKLRADAAALAGRLAMRTAKKAERKAATALEAAAVRAQRQRWGASYRLLASLDDGRVQALLADTHRKK